MQRRIRPDRDRFHVSGDGLALGLLALELGRVRAPFREALRPRAGPGNMEIEEH